MFKKLCFIMLMGLFSASLAFSASPITNGLMLHLEADAITGIDDGAPITDWLATVGNDATIAGTAPTFVADVGNGAPGVNFGNGYINFDRMTNIRTVFWVLKEDADALGDGFMLGDSSVYHFHRETGTKAMWHATHTHANIKNGVTKIDGSAVNGQVTAPPTSLSIVSVVTTGNVTARSFSKDRTSAGRNWDGVLAELLVFDGALVSGAESEVGLYLAAKYGLTTSYTTPKFYVHGYSPADGAQRVGQDTQLSWEGRAADETPTYTVYFGTDPNDVDPDASNFTDSPVATTQDSFYAPDAALAPATLYYWRVEAYQGIDDSNSLTSDIFTFTTGGDIADLSPGGAIGLATDDLTISWAAESAESTYIDGYNVYLGETLPGTPTDTVTENQLMVSGLTDGTLYQCKVESMHDGSPVSETTASFTTGELVGYWPFDGNLTDVVDANDGSRAITQFADGFIDESPAADFAGDFAKDPIYVPLLHAVGAKANWTISLWEYSYAGGGGWESILGNGTDAAGWGTFEFGRLNGNRYVFGLNQGGGYKYTPDDSSFLREGWHFHAISHDSTARTIRWYVDGGLVNTYTGTNVTLAPELIVGNVDPVNGDQPFNGKVDDLKFYSRPLTAGQALQAYIDGVNGAPINPVPASGTGNMPWENVTLEWALVEVPTGITIEIGKEADLSDATPIVLAADAASFDTLTGLGVKLDPSTGYFWRVTATYSDKVSPSPTWFFTVRDLTGDLSGNLVVGAEDVSQLATEWLNDALEYVPSGTEFNFVDQEVWGRDPNLDDYDAYASGGPWGTCIYSIKTDPTPETDPESTYTPPSQTLLLTATGEAGKQQIAGLAFVDPINFNDFDKFGFWAYQSDDCGGNFIFRPIDMNGNQPFNKTVWGMNSNNGKWYRYEWEIGGVAASNIRKVDIWYSDNEFTMEFGNWFVVKDGVEVGICREGNRIAEDLNGDCSVNLVDAAIMGADWMLDASN